MARRLSRLHHDSRLRPVPNKAQGKIMKLVVVAGLTLALTRAALAADIDAGETSFRKCLPCHAVGENARNKVGPVLNGLEGRRSGTIEGYSYTQANKDAGMTWSDASFKDYIMDPRGKIPGTKMIFNGIKDEEEIGNLWAYLRQFGPDGKKK
jgi:cytochrome c